MTRDTRAALQRAAMTGVAPVLPSGFGDNFFASLQATAFSETTMGRHLSMSRSYDAFAEEIEGRTGSRLDAANPSSYEFGLGLSDEQSLEYRTAKYERWARAVRDAGAEPPSLEAVETRAAELVRERVDRAGRVALGNVGASPAAGRIVGGMAGVLLDPPVLASMFFGAAGSSGILRTAAVEGALGAVTEAAIQPGIQEWRAEVGLPAGAAEAFRNIGLAAGGGFFFAGALKSAARGYGRIRDSMRESVARSASERHAQAYMERFAAALAENPHSDRGGAEHVRRYTQAQNDLAEGRPQQNPVDPAAPVRADQLETRLNGRDPPERATALEAAAFKAGQEMRARALEGIGSLNELRAAKEMATELLRSEKTLGDMLEQVRRKRLERPAGVQSLIDDLRAAGGIRVGRGEPAGDLAAIGINSKSRLGLVRKGGMTLDAATQRAWERGFIGSPLSDRPDIGVLMDALRDDFEGRRVYRAKDQNLIDDYQAIQRGIDEFAEALSEMGIDPNKLPAPEVVGRLRAIAEEPLPGGRASRAEQSAAANARDLGDIDNWQDAMDADLEARVREAYAADPDREVWLGEGDTFSVARAGDVLDELDAETRAVDEWRACLGVDSDAA